MKTGSEASLLRWDELGRAGREYIVSGPRSPDLDAFSGRSALEPIRVYVGLRSAETAVERAQLALAELKRTGAFERSVLIIVMPTGTGWIDPAAMDTVEYLHNGDIASVAMQYSYLTSWLSLLVEPGYGGEAARRSFLRSLWLLDHPSQGQSSETLSAWAEPRRDELRIVERIVRGACRSISGSAVERPAVHQQNLALGDHPSQSEIAGWLPRFRDGSFVRFTNQENALPAAGTRWGPMRYVYLQYASDPVTFFDYRSLYETPAWTNAPRGPDVSPELRWYPIVTFLQLGLDMAMATTTPIGYGHVFAAEHYVDPWIELTEPQGWTPADIARLKEKLTQQRHEPPDS